MIRFIKLNFRQCLNLMTLMTVQRVSKESVEKLRVLSYFLPPEEAHEKKTFDSLLNRLIQTYTETSMNNRQKDMYNTLLEKEREQ